MNSRHILRTTVGCLTVVCTMLVWGIPAKAGDPVLVMPEKEFKFGYAIQNASISHPFLIRNGGGDTLYILDVNPG